MLILSSAYFGPVQYFSRFINQPAIKIEQYDHYIKQTYRNRCIIGSAAGPLTLSVPVKRKRGKKTLVKDVRVDYDTNWRKIHLLGIISCYNSSPYFEYLRDDIEPFFYKKYNFLIDMNMAITRKMLECTGIDCRAELSSHYEPYESSSGIADYREIIHPKINMEEDECFLPIPYTQVFSNETGFLPNLSILDLIFNTGKEAGNILKRCRRDLAE